MTDRSLIRFFLGFTRQYKWRFLLAFALMPVYAGLMSISPIVTQRAIDFGIVKGDLKYTIAAGFVYLGLVLLAFITMIAQNISMQSAGIRTLAGIRAKAMRHICFLGKGQYDKQPLGVYVSRTTSDVEAIGETMTAGLTNLIGDALLIIFIFINILLVNAQLGLWTLILLPLLILIVDVFRRILRRLFDQIRTINGRLTARVNEALTMVFELQNFNLTTAFMSDFKKQNNKYRDRNIQTISHEALLFSIIEGMSFIAIGAVLILVARSSLLDDGLGIGGIVAYIQWLWLIFPPIKQMGGRFAVLQSALAAVNKIHQVMSIPLPKDTGTESVDGTNLELKNLNFSYIQDEPVLNGIDLQVAPGSSLAIVGATGSGKSTIIRLVTRQYDLEPDNGEILLGNTSIQQIPRQCLKEAVVLVPQEPSIFHETVFYNISLNRADVTEAQVEDICRDIMADEFIRQLPDGYSTVLDSEGTNLSMGQRQLIALARALASPAEILIFDEATANIDTRTEIMIQKALDYVMQHKTTILIAHRLSTIRDADSIVVLQKGQIVDRGSHEELLARPGLYRKMYELQTRFDH